MPGMRWDGDNIGVGGLITMRSIFHLSRIDRNEVILDVKENLLTLVTFTSTLMHMHIEYSPLFLTWWCSPHINSVEHHQQKRVRSYSVDIFLYTIKNTFRSQIHRSHNTRIKSKKNAEIEKCNSHRPPTQNKRKSGSVVHARSTKQRFLSLFPQSLRFSDIYHRNGKS
jgi:hypothetical protein